MGAGTAARNPVDPAGSSLGIAVAECACNDLEDMMNRSHKHMTGRALLALAALAAGSLAVGCQAQVVGGGEGGGGADSVACTTLGDVKQCEMEGYTAECVEIN